jgi:hypothetical protein
MVGQALQALGYADWKAGIEKAPEQEMRESIAIFKELNDRGRAYALGAMQQYRRYLEETHRGPEAKQVALEAEQFSKQRGKCPNCTVSVYGLQRK